MKSIMARRAKGLHHNLPFADPYGGEKNVVYHREHVSPRNRRRNKLKTLVRYKKSSRRNWNQQQKDPTYLSIVHKKRKKKC